MSNKEVWWAPALEIFTEVSSYIVVPILIALIAGKALDAHFGTRPWIFLAFIGLSFIVSVIGIFKVIRRYSQKLKEISKEESNTQQ